MSLIINLYNIFKRKEQEISLDELFRMQKQGAFIIDVRSLQEYQEGHINGSISIPDYEIESKIESFVKEKDCIIILYCSSGLRSRRILKKLEKMGYKNIYNLRNGWQNA